MNLGSSAKRGQVPHLAPFVMEKASIEIDGNRILNDISLRIEAGDFVAILGENGSGKTTLLRSLVGLLPLTLGSLTVYGQPIEHFSQWSSIAYVPQRLMAQTAVPVSVEEAVMAARISPSRRFTRDVHLRGATQAALETVGLWSRRNDRLDTLSGGQQRRVMVARALACEASTLILDEPTAGIDADSELRMADTLADLHSAGKTIILVTHDLGPITDMANHVIVVGGKGTNAVLYDGPAPPPREIYDHVWHHHDDEPDPRGPNPSGLVSGP